MSGGSGWGLEWGETFWGDNTDDDLALLAVTPIAENVLRLAFNLAPRFSLLATADDASLAARYTVTPVAASTGMDGLVPRPVSAIIVGQDLTDDPGGRLIDVSLDRAMSPYPARYTISVAGLVVDATGNPLNPSFVSLDFFGCQRTRVVRTPEVAMPSRDMANPQTLAMLLESDGTPTPNALGTHPVDTTGDYAVDEGLANLKKRVFRRLMTVKDSFAHAPGYGVGIGSGLKRLNTPALQSALAKDAESQIAQEPDVRKVKVKVNVKADAPNVLWFYVFVQTVTGLGVKFEVPLNQA